MLASPALGGFEQVPLRFVAVGSCEFDRSEVFLGRFGRNLKNILTRNSFSCLHPFQWLAFF